MKRWCGILDVSFYERTTIKNNGKLSLLAISKDKVHGSVFLFSYHLFDMLTIVLSGLKL